MAAFWFVLGMMVGALLGYWIGAGPQPVPLSDERQLAPSPWDDWWRQDVGDEKDE